MSLESVQSFFSARRPDIPIIETQANTATVELAAQAHGVAPGRIAKTLAFRLGDGRAILLVVRGDARISNPKFKAVFGKGKMLPADEVEALTGHPVGGVCPFGLAQALPVYLDQSLKVYDEVLPAAGSINSAVRISVSQLADITEGVWVDVCQAPDIRLIACDLDGTLLDAEHEISADFWPLLKQLKDKSIVFCPASGRQYFKLWEQFQQDADGLVFIAENGTCVMRDGQELRSDCLEKSVVHDLVRTGRSLQATGAQTGSVLCGKRAAYIEWKNPAFQAEVSRYYQRLEIVDDLLNVDDDFLKLAVFDFASSQQNVYPAFAHFSATHQVVVSGVHWLDVMVAHANKGTGLRHVQEILGVEASQTMVLGDYLNDLEMMDQAHYSFAMENAHPQLKARARFTAPANTDNGVVRAIRNLLGLEISSN